MVRSGRLTGGPGPEWEELPERARRRLIATEVVRSAVVAVAVVVGYFLVPLSGRLSLGGVVWIAAALVAIAGLLAWQVRGVRTSPYPAATAVGGLMVTVPLFLAAFAAVYYAMGRSEPASWSEPLTKLDAFYLAVTVFATVGFGDISAQSQAARGAITLQMLGGLVLVGVIARIVVGAVQERRRAMGRGQGS